MAKALKKGRRRIPTQPRAQMTVQSILDAAGDLVVRKGYQHATTNRIAAAAGVPVSSLYQYFASREAVMLALYESITSKTAQIMREKILREIDSPTEVALPVIALALLNFYEKPGRVIFRLLEEAPHQRADFQSLSVELLFHGASRVFLEQHNFAKDSESSEKILFFMQNAIMANINQFIRLKPEFLTREDFVREISDMLIGYLRTRDSR
jgi:AcrR family transcriptional regulator